MAMSAPFRSVVPRDAMLKHGRQASRAARLAVRASAEGKLKVVVTGAAGRTGALVVKKLAERPQQFEAAAVVRNEKSKGKVAQLGVPEAAIFMADVSAAREADFVPAFKGAAAVVIATSGVPQIKPLSILKVLWAKVTGQEGVRPEFVWKEGQRPEQVDWLGQKAQIDAARTAGVRHVVIVSSMGGTQPDNMLNKLGEGNILQWKRKAEQYLVASGLDYTILHPGGLINKPGGERELVIGVDDELLTRKQRSIPRADVAELAVQCLTLPQARNRSIDVITLPEGEGKPTTDFAKLLSDMPKNCDYSINSQMPAVASKA